MNIRLHSRIIHARSQLYFIIVPVEEVKLGKMIVGIFSDLNLLAVFPSPFPLFRFEHVALGKVSMHNGMYYQLKVFMLMGDEVA